MITYNNVNVASHQPIYFIDRFQASFQYVLQIGEQFPKPLGTKDSAAAATIKLRVPTEDEMDGWLAISQDTFSFWDNPLDAAYDDL